MPFRPILLALLASVPSVPAQEDLSKLLEPIRTDAGLPALGAAAIVDGKLKALGAVGLRKHDGKAEVTTPDKWHIGSCTKSMTATLAATLVEEGQLSWETTIGELLGPKMKMRKEYQEVTLRTLLANRSGIPGKVPPEIWQATWKKNGKGSITTRRREFVEAMLNVKPAFKPGTRYGYSNQGFVTAGAMLEALTGQSWEELMQERIFKPLKMTSAGFGAPAERNKEDQPWAHHQPDKPQLPGPGDDNPQVLGPAGTVHCSLPDLARYVRMHLLRETGPILKKAETYKTLHTAAEGNQNYALGWVVLQRGWAKGKALNHNGSNTMNYCVIWFAPERGFAAMAVSNTGGDQVARSCDQAVAGLVRKYVK